jgi:amino acid adenylation domain-containing protein
MTDIQKKISVLSPEKRALLALRLKQKGEAFNTFPLSFAQERLWVIDQLAPGSAAYNIPTALRLTGKINLTALEQSVNEIVRRHEVLRTTYRMVDAGPVQAVSPATAASIPVVDLTLLPASEREIETHRLVEEEAQRPFNLLTGPMFRVTLLRLEAREHVLLFTMHHIVSDLWSTGVLIREVAMLYEAFSEGQPSPLEELPIQYADFAVWQRKWLQGEELEKQLGYWKKQLEGAPPVLDLPTDRPRPAVQTLRGNTFVMELPEALSNGLRELSKREDATLFMLMLAAFKVLLYRYTSQSDLVVGIPIANRNRAQTEALIGFFVNTLVLRTDLSGEPTFREVVRRVRETSLEAYAHQDLPFEKIVQELNPERNQSFAPLFQVIFGLQPQAREEEQYELRGLTLSALDTESGTSKFDLVQKIVETKKGLTSYLHYSTDLFDATTIRRMATHFRHLLEGIIEHPEEHISRLPLLNEEERAQQLTEWNDTTVEYPRRLTLHELFEAQAERTPHAVAVVYENEQLTYGELNERANGLAHLLVAQGVGQEVLVALLAERGLDLLTAILAVFKAGGAYLPLDPRAPASRLRHIIAESSTPVVLVAAHYLPIVEQALENSPAVPRPQVLELEELLARRDRDEPRAQGHAAQANLPPRSGPDSLAYVIYTSGSTGIPKGAMVEQRGMVNHLYAKVNDLALTETDKVAQTASQCFDISVWQMLSALVVGGQVEIFPDHVAHDMRQLLNAVEQRGITILETVPSLLRAMLDEAAPSNARSTTTAVSLTNAESAASGHQLRALRWMIPTGEALPPDLCRRWLAAYGHVPLMNAYGPTECSDDVSHHPIHEAPSREEMNVPIGRPVANLRLYVVDKYLRAVPVGVRGELYVGGVGVGRGYLGEPSRTAETFMPDPFSAEAGKRLYRTGDLACWRADGCVEFLGRIDNQVKVRGFRIELGEIEAALTNLDGVEEAVVIVHENGAGAKNLVAYLVGASALADELRNSLKERLPDYMIPSTFVRLAVMPLTSNGKIDRQALPAPDIGWPEMEHSFVAPRTPVEKWLAQKWADVLEMELEAIGVESNFFSMGGDSIKAAIIVNRVQDALSEVVHVVTIFDAPTVAGFARYLEERYAHAVAHMLGETGAVVSPGGEVAVESLVTKDEIEQLRRLSAEARTRVAPLSAAGRASGHRTVNLKPTLFVLSPPRSGSTLLRVLLGGHPRLFAPPELELLGFETMRQRREMLSGRDRFWLEGVVRCVMQLRGCAVEDAQQLVAEYEQQGASTSEFYGVIQEWLGAGRMLVDKTPSYALEAEVLQRAEEEFGTQARYIHLVRRPEAMIHSFVEAQLDQIFPRFAHPFDGREVAELIWDISQENILGFLQEVETGRQHRVVFEELVGNPRQVLEGVCEFLDVEFDEQMMKPYAEREKRMTDGIHAESKMLGDVKFHEHRGIEAGVGERWREMAGAMKIGEVTRALANSLGYRGQETGELMTQVTPASVTGVVSRRTLIPVSQQREENQTQFPLSFAQERLWFLDQLEPDSTFYNISIAARLSGQLNRTALEKTLSEIVRRHEVLRTSFQFINGRPAQVVSPAEDLSLPLTDLNVFAEAEREGEVERLIAEEAHRPLKLERGSALRMSLVRLNEAEHVVLFTMHHIVADGWSLGVLVREVAALYEAFSEGRPSPLEELPIQYADFAVWQRDWLQGAELEEQLSYWKRQLSGGAMPLRLPTDRPRTATPKFHGASHSFTLPAESVEKLKALSRKENVTLFMALLAGLQTLLYRLTGETDISVGTDMAGRNRAEIENLIGFFVNLLVMRVDLSGEPSFRELLGRVRETCMGAYAHQDLPFEKLVEELNPERSASSTPLFRVLFVYQNTPRGTLELPGLKFSLMPADNETSKFDLALFIGEMNEGIHGTWRYNTDLFDDSTLARLSGHFKTLIENATAEPDARLSTLEMLTESEKQGQAAEQKRRVATNLKRFKSIKPKAVSLPQGNLIRTGLVVEGSTAPLVIEPEVENLDLADWAQGRRSLIETWLLKHGALLFRGFNVKTVADFESFAKTQCQELFGEYGDLPREGLGGKVYGSTPYPSDQAILFHNESSHMHRWPMKIWFLCLKAAEEGGETPLVDCRKVYQALDPEIRERFAEKKLMYVRNYIEGLDVSWQSFFRTRDKEAVEEFCRKASIEFEWRNGNDLRTRQVCSAVSQHPRTGEDLFFNQIQLHHISCLNPAVRKSMQSDFDEKDFPRNVYYGDGSLIEDAVVDALRETYRQVSVSFLWQAGDIVMLDNMLTAHGRNPFSGERKVVVALGEMIEKEEAEHASDKATAVA